MRLSIILPVYNEERTITTVLDRLKNADTLGMEKEILIVDDGSTDKTREILALRDEPTEKKILLDRNLGKGGAIKKALAQASGDWILIQDADLEYDIADYPVLLAPIVNGQALAVFGSRNLISHRGNPLSPGNTIMTQLFNLGFKTKLTDVATCYKLFPSAISKDVIAAKYNDFALDVIQLTAIIARKYPIIEVPIRYTPRWYEDGKKLTIRHGLKIGWCLMEEIASNFFLDGQAT